MTYKIEIAYQDGGSASVEISDEAAAQRIARFYEAHVREHRPGTVRLIKVS